MRKLGQLLGIHHTIHRGRELQIMAQTKKEKEYTDLYCDVIEALGLDAVSYPFSMGLQRTSETTARDKYGRIYTLSTHGGPLPAQPLITSASDLRDFDMASQLISEDFSEVERIVARFKGAAACCMPLNDPFQEGWYTVGGMQSLLLSFRENPELVHRLLRAMTAFLTKAVDLGASIGIEVIVLVGDYAHEKGLLFSLQDYREYLKPLHLELVEHAHGKGLLIVKHSDGNVWPLLDDWMEVGFDGIHPIQPQCMDIEKVKRYVGQRIAVLGNIDCRDLLVFGTQEQVVRAVKETIKRTAPGGGYIISSSNSIHPACRPENYLAMVEAAHQYGSY